MQDDREDPEGAPCKLTGLGATWARACSQGLPAAAPARGLRAPGRACGCGEAACVRRAGAQSTFPLPSWVRAEHRSLRLGGGCVVGKAVKEEIAKPCLFFCFQRTFNSRASELLWMALALWTVLPSRMSLRSLKWSLLLLSLLSFLVMWYLSLPHYNVIERVNWMYFYEYEPIYRQDFHFTLREHSNCSHQNPFLVILVTSHPSDVKARQAIRVTWGEKKSWWGYEVLTFFLLGQEAEKEDKMLALSLEDEHLLYGDIIRQDFLDTYNNLTLKTIMAFRWVTEFCPNAKYIMKTDTDVFINTGNLVKYLLNVNHSEKFFTGYPLIDNYSYRGFYQKTHISYQEYPFKVFPPYCSGLGYIMSRDLVPRIYEMMGHVKPIKFEDVYVGICLNLLKVNIHIPEDTNLFFLYRIHLDVCQLRRVIAAHGFSSKEIITFWQVMLRNTTCHY
uniref:Hexosyltransferase n=2 Tax=Theropithecus gelada TaxID=9565 RepID=A0A8D2E7D0_THEGE